MDIILSSNSNLPDDSNSVEKQKLLKKSEQIIEKSINNIQQAFIEIGKALIEIKDKRTSVATLSHQPLLV